MWNGDTIRNEVGVLEELQITLSGRKREKDSREEPLQVIGQGRRMYIGWRAS